MTFVNWKSAKDNLPIVEDEILCRSREVLITDEKETFIGYVQYDFDPDGTDDPTWRLQGRDAYDIDGIVFWAEIPKLVLDIS